MAKIIDPLWEDKRRWKDKREGRDAAVVTAAIRFCASCQGPIGPFDLLVDVGRADGQGVCSKCVKGSK